MQAFIKEGQIDVYCKSICQQLVWSVVRYCQPPFAIVTMSNNVCACKSTSKTQITHKTSGTEWFWENACHLSLTGTWYSALGMRETRDTNTTGHFLSSLATLCCHTVRASYFRLANKITVGAYQHMCWHCRLLIHVNFNFVHTSAVLSTCPTFRQHPKFRPLFLNASPIPVGSDKASSVSFQTKL